MGVIVVDIERSFLAGIRLGAADRRSARGDAPGSGGHQQARHSH
jgi:hypothetical protein